MLGEELKRVFFSLKLSTVGSLLHQSKVFQHIPQTARPSQSVSESEGKSVTVREKVAHSRAV